MNPHFRSEPRPAVRTRSSPALLLLFLTSTLLLFAVFLTADSPYFDMSPGPLRTIPVALADPGTGELGEPQHQHNWRFTTIVTRQLTWGEVLTDQLLPTETGEVVRAAPLTDDEVRTGLADQMAVSNERATTIANFLVPTPQVEVRITSAVGNSAGLMATLAALDAKDDHALHGGRLIAGTGAIDSSGAVLPVLSVGVKMGAAAAEGADLFFAPPDTTTTTRVGAMEVVEVASVEEALAFLCADTPHTAACTP